MSLEDDVQSLALTVDAACALLHRLVEALDNLAATVEAAARADD